MATLSRAALLVASMVVTACGPALHMQIPAPRGRYAVGRSSIVLVDSARVDPWTNDERRVVVVKAWYPAEATSAAPRSAYLPDASRLPGRFDFGERFVAKHLGTHAYEQAPLARDTSVFPVLLFSSGNDMSPEFYSGLLEELASHGYVVLGIDHSHEGKGQLLPDGRILAVEVDRQRPKESTAAITAFYKKRAEMRAADASFVLDQANAAPSVFAGHLDLARVGVLGHSVGGVSAALVCRRDARVRACVNLDGLVNAKPALRDGDSFAVGRPFMFLGKPLPFKNPAVADSARRELDAAIASRTNETYDVVLDGFHHDTFSDYPFFTPTFRPTKNRANLELVRDYTLAFFERTLRGDANTSLTARDRVQVTRLDPARR